MRLFLLMITFVANFGLIEGEAVGEKDGNSVGDSIKMGQLQQSEVRSKQKNCT